MSQPLVGDWSALVDPVIKKIVRQELRVGLSAQNDRRENQDAFDVVQNVYLKLAQSLEKSGDGIGDLEAYAAGICYHECAEYLRARFPERTRLNNKIRYFLTHEPGFTVWKTTAGSLQCGYAGWTARAPATAEAVNALAMDPTRIPSKTASGTLAVTTLDSMKRGDWQTLMEGIFDVLGGPVRVNDVVAIASARFRSKDQPGDATLEASVESRLDDVLYQRQRMKDLWRVLQDFDHRWLMAFMLNLPGATREGRGEIETFVESGATSLQAIGRLLGWTAEEYERLRQERPQLGTDPGSAEGRMAIVWSHVPLEDAVLGKVLGCEKQQVINLRAVAMQKAKKRLQLLTAE